jgi:hypothetical protein
MRPEIRHLLQRQAQWQKNLKNLSWPEKIRVAEQLRDSIAKLRASHRDKSMIPQRVAEHEKRSS